MELSPQVRTLLDEVIEAVTRKASEPDGGHCLGREQISFASRETKEVAGVAETKDGAPAIFHRSVDAKTTFEQMKDVRGWITFPANCPEWRVSLDHLGCKETLERAL
jgi:hypothetical protein